MGYTIHNAHCCAHTKIYSVLDLTINKIKTEIYTLFFCIHLIYIIGNQLLIGLPIW